MEWKWIFRPRPSNGDSTVLGRTGLVFYWLGLSWLFPWVVGGIVAGIAEANQHGAWALVAYIVMCSVIGAIGFALGRALLFIMANR